MRLTFDELMVTLLFILPVSGLPRLLLLVLLPPVLGLLLPEQLLLSKILLPGAVESLWTDASIGVAVAVAL